jgi:FixJ family two-component response regulator
MRRSAAVLSHDASSVRTLKIALEELGIERISCSTKQQALELVLAGACTTLIADFDLPEARDVVKMAAFLEPPQKPEVFAIGSRAWPGTGEAFQSGAGRILYKPLDLEQVREALEDSGKLLKSNRRQSPRHEMRKTVVYLELETGTVPGIGIDISEHGFAVQATEPVPMHSSLAFRCVLPGTNYKLHGHADVIWASDQGRAGLFFSRLSPAARKQLKHWLRGKSHGEDSVRALLPPVDEPECVVSSK